MGAVEIELLYFEGCPNWQLADTRAREALHAVGDATKPVTYRTAGNPDEAERLGFRGSPTILASGRDDFARPGDPVGLACRLYPSAGGGDHSPAVQQIQAVLADAA
jgi:hypothetical protein